MMHSLKTLFIRFSLPCVCSAWIMGYEGLSKLESVAIQYFNHLTSDDVYANAFMCVITG
ncbi:hypothetical protein K8O89_07635 [Legionella anisa]|uniref:hypothetical protein n=1 Tax=Legionella anisa TaxID=28082 RepID=UPI001CC0C1CD|nr:hypothetical protein [Legionella anisa]UAK80883.1 hypothetical protein K8O89_07635 [Legionella anisa]